jgi:hypothetical protein
VKEVITSGEGIAAFLIGVEATTAGDEKGVVVLEFVVDAFKVIFPVTVFVNFVEYDKWFGCVWPREGLKEKWILHEFAFIGGDIPVEIELVGE